MQACFKILEEGYKPILRKLLPGPHTYKSMSGFDQDVDQLVNRYTQDAPACRYP